MIEALKSDEIVNKVGGRFKLSTLIQKRMIMLNTGARPLVEVPHHLRADKMAIVIQEILQDKIYLDQSGELRTRNNAAAYAPGAGGARGPAASSPSASPTNCSPC